MLTVVPLIRQALSQLNTNMFVFNKKNSCIEGALCSFAEEILMRREILADFIPPQQSNLKGQHNL